MRSGPVGTARIRLEKLLEGPQKVVLVSKPSYYSIYGTPGPVMPQFGPDFPFHNLSKDSNEAATKISQAKLGGFCNELLSGQRDSGNDNESPSPARRTLQARRTNYNSNQSFNINSNSGSGGRVSSYSSSYSNNNGHISGIESGYPGKTGQGYSYTYSNEGTGPPGSSSYGYTLNGLRVPKELQGYTPKAIKEGCERALSGPSHPQVSQGRPPRPLPSPGPPGPSGTRPIHRLEQPGLPIMPYVLGQFKKYRQACGNVCAKAPLCGGFVVSTDFSTTSCDLVIRHRVGRGDFIDQSQARGYKYHVEGYRKISSRQ
ncbi:hypothetical protein L211DRAFT_846314 [Terfezia boudieri ATCC MYA-4762]|uniref:Uncharacterized protein n=1 Tax=Terfezia boudieri ATCC MYA-4762 TaxID=1051890 RepID=A0A3N4M2C0_9PEZI|nr:hypothetical protein L211DRAFT_846314 [Terfezia boudieri ATCC MYA-4762]